MSDLPCALRRYPHAAPVPANYFDKRIAESYEAKWPELFEPASTEN